MAVQLAHDAGAYVIATASGKNIDLVRSLGADDVIDYRADARHDHGGAFVLLSDAASVLPEAIALFLAGRLPIVTDTTFDLDDTRAAPEKLSTGHARGKVLIRTSR